MFVFFFNMFVRKDFCCLNFEPLLGGFLFVSLEFVYVPGVFWNVFF